MEELNNIQYEKTLGYVASIDSTQTEGTSFSTTQELKNDNSWHVENLDPNYHSYGLRQSQSSDEVFCEAQNLLLNEKNLVDVS